MFVKALDIVVNGKPKEGAQISLFRVRLLQIIAQSIYIFKYFNKV
jgi:hypothetical protein